MSENTLIEWADHTFNPWIGCTKVSPGCANCYAEAWDRRFAVSGHAMRWGSSAQRTRTKPANWRKPMHWNEHAAEFHDKHGRRQRVFCASLSDVFDNAVPQEWRKDLFALIEQTPHLDWLLVTKRIGNVPNMLPVPFDFDQIYPNVWLGITVVNQTEANRDIPKLLQVPARVRFLSIEPMLGPIDLERPRPGPDLDQGGGRMICQPWLIQSGIDWVICGGESGPQARPMHPDWARSLRDQCAAAGVPFLFKQWGEWLPINQQEEEFTRKLYRSNRVARLHEDQGNLDDIYGRTCTVPGEVVHCDGSRHGVTEPMAFVQGTSPMTTFKVGKRAAGRLLDGVKCGEWFHNAHACAADVEKALRKCCEMCDDGDGHCVFPYYGVAPHTHDTGNGWIGSTRLVPREQWGPNFREDPDCEGSGVYMRCPHCGRGERPSAERLS